MQLPSQVARATAARTPKKHPKKPAKSPVSSGKVVKSTAKSSAVIYYAYTSYTRTTLSMLSYILNTILI